jgi:flagellar hook protein FlgE
VDEDRWVIDNEGRRLQILPTTSDGSVTAVGASALQPLRLPLTSGDPRATTAVRFVANLPADAAAPVATFARDNPASYNGATSTTVHAADGSAQTATVYYRRLESPPGDTNKYWEIRSFVGDAEIGPLPGPGPQQLTFDEDGALTAPSGPVSFSGGFTISHADSTTLSQPFSVPFSEQDGYAPGRLEGVGVDQAGVVRASFSNGETIAVGKLALGNVANPQGLKQNGNVSWTLSPTSGPLQVGEAAQDGYGNIASGSLERSNVDLTEELVGLISAQRNFQANARAIDTASTLLQTIIQLRT